MTVVLLDTNVLVYAFDRTEPEKRAQAMKVILETQNHSAGCLSIQCLSEFFNAVTRGAEPKLPIDEALQHVQDFLQAFPVYLLTPSVVIEAARGVRDHSLSFYDAQIWASALINDVPVIFSEDFQDGQTLEGVRFVNPFAENFELEKWL
ncbi:MAG: PIN domain-containing protein [Chloroflexi bacterium]|nr:PIN domain-containing protein [Chloroflexota bacterium]MDL1941493.1 PIN domain-containing protein [Chloroflexi bacterium CFX2]